jgi:mannonate dehydratase
MYIGEQLINPTDDRLRLSAQLGCKGIVIDSRPNRDVCNSDGSWELSGWPRCARGSKVSA